MAAHSFSRLQLAAALLGKSPNGERHSGANEFFTSEYDNDPDDPTAEFTSAKESAIFAHLRRPAPVRRVEDDFPRGDDEEDEDVPIASRKSVINAQKRAQYQAHGNPDARASVVPSVVDPEAEEEAEMLSAWGLDGIVPKSEKRNSTLSMGQASGTRSRPLSQHLPVESVPLETPIIRPGLARPLSLGDMNALVVDGPERIAEPMSAPADNRKSMAVQLDFNVVSPPEPSAALLTAEPRNSIGFPHAESPRGTPGEEIANPFAVALPEGERLSRFDPKVAANDRRASIMSLNKDLPEGRPKSWIADEFLNEPGSRPRSRYSSLGDQLDVDSNVPNPSRRRTGSAGTPDIPEPSPMPSPKEHEAKRLSRLDLLRPKVLVMPTPLQEKLPTTKKTRDGFFKTDDGGFPLPLGSRTQVRPGPRPMSSLNVLDPNANPRMSMSLSQLTFRQTLMVGGERDPSYFDIDRELKVAEQDGIQIKQDWSDEEDDTRKPAGKLYGTSLIDNLEQRKAAIKGKQRYG